MFVWLANNAAMPTYAELFSQELIKLAMAYGITLHAGGYKVICRCMPEKQEHWSF